MKRIFTTVVGLLFTVAAFSQYYYIPQLSPGQNPGGLNTDEEQPGATGWSELLPGSQTSPTWSSTGTIPFTFQFNGNTVTSYKVSSSGVLTFTTSAVTVPPSANAIIPSNDIPDNSVMVWGLEASGTNDVIRNKTFGTAPFRQHWVQFSSYSAPGASGSQWTYWGFVFEETTNNIYIVDQRTYNTPVSLSIGLQINNTTAFAVPGAPNTGSLVTANSGNGDQADDNVYYEFRPGTQPAYDFQHNTINIANKLKLSNGPFNISGSLQNNGSATITSFDLNYTVNGGSAVTVPVSGVSIAPGASYNYTHATAWTPASGGVYDLEVWADNLNGNADDYPYDDLKDKNVLVNLGISAPKHVLLEEFTTAPCGYCPDGALKVENIINSQPNTIPIGLHACFSTDAMTIPAASAYCTEFSNAAPTATVDRVLFPGEAQVGISRSIWASKVTERMNAGAPVNVLINGDFDPATRKLNATVTSEFVDFSYDGDLRVTLFVVEDSVVGPNSSGYNQRNYYSAAGGAAGGSTHPYYNEPDPIIGYVHRHVLRDVPSGTWGSTNVFSGAPAPNLSGVKTYSNITINNNYNLDHVKLVAFVSYYNNATNGYEVLNARQIRLKHIYPVGIQENVSGDKVGDIYPNPAKSIAFMEVELASSRNATVELMNAYGQKVTVVKEGLMTSGKHSIAVDLSNLAAGIYFVNVSLDDQSFTKKLIVH